MSKSERNLTAVFTDTANAIRNKKESSELISPVDFADEIATIETGIEPTGTKNIYANGNNIDVYNYAAVNVNVPNPSTGTLDISNNGQYDVTTYANDDVNVQGGVTPTGEKIIDYNGVYDISAYASAVTCIYPYPYNFNNGAIPTMVEDPGSMRAGNDMQQS